MFYLLIENGAPFTPNPWNVYANYSFCIMLSCIRIYSLYQTNRRTEQNRRTDRPDPQCGQLGTGRPHIKRIDHFSTLLLQQLQHSTTKQLNEY